LFVSATGDYYGAPRSMHLLIEGLLPRGYHLEVAIAAPGLLADRLRASGVAVHVSPVDPYSARRLPKGASWLAPALKLWRRVGWALWLAKLTRARRPRVLYVNTFRGVTAALIGRIIGVPVVWHLRGLETGIGGPSYRRLRLALLRRVATRAIAVSEAVAREALAAGYPPARLALVYNGVDAQALEAASTTSDDALRAVLGAGPAEVVIAYVGRVAADKGIFDFLTAAGLLVDHDARMRFAVIGGPIGPQGNLDWAAIQTALDRVPGLTARVRFTDFVDHPYPLMRVSDVIVLSSHDEGFSRALLEAMALGRAIVATAVSGTPEAIRDGEHGLLVPPRNPPALAKTIARVGGDATLRHRLGAAAQRRVREQFTLDSATEGVVRVLRALLDT